MTYNSRSGDPLDRQTVDRTLIIDLQGRLDDVFRRSRVRH